MLTTAIPSGTEMDPSATAIGLVDPVRIGWCCKRIDDLQSETLAPVSISASCCVLLPLSVTQMLADSVNGGGGGAGGVGCWLVRWSGGRPGRGESLRPGPGS